MHYMRRAFFVLILLFATMLAFGEDAPDVGSNSASQAAADLLREYAGADGAFIAAGLINKTFDKDNLASLIQYPTDEVVVVSLTGSEVRQALERSVSLYPLPNPSFLQLSGIEATFSKGAAIGQRIVNVTVGGVKLDDKRTYAIAMPASLAQGGSGYFKIWDSSKIAKTFKNVTVASVLKGKHAADTSPRWSVVG